MSRHHARPVAARFEHGREVFNLAVQRHRRRRITQADPGSVVRHDAGSWCDQRHDARPGQGPRFAEGRVEHDDRTARSCLGPPNDPAASRQFATPYPVTHEVPKQLNYRVIHG